MLMMPRTQAPLTNPLIVAGTATAFAAAYAIMGTEPGPLVRLFVDFGPVIALISWTIADRRQSDLASVYDWGFFQCIAWPVLIPWYLKRQYGSGAWPLLAVFLGLILVPQIAAAFAARP